MKLSKKLGLAAVSAVAVTAAATLPGVGSTASAAPTIVLTAGGSDTTESVVDVILQQYVSSPANTGGVGVANIPAVPKPTYVVPADAGCGSRTYVVSGNPPTNYTAPNGSGAGRNALKDPTNLANGCIDIARSSSPRSGSDPAQFKYFAFALDGVSWSAFNGGRAPASLTKTQIKAIYNCDFTDWSEVGGTAGRIQRYIPQSGSGTRSFFISNVLDGADPTTVSNAACPAVKTIEENKGDEVTVADRPFAILPYSAGQWIAQANGVITNHRSSTTIRAIGTPANAENPVGRPRFGHYKPNEAVLKNGTFPGARRVFNVLHTDALSYAEARKAVGFNEAAPTVDRSPLCSGAMADVLREYGFVPLDPDANGTTCLVN